MISTEQKYMEIWISWAKVICSVSEVVAILTWASALSTLGNLIWIKHYLACDFYILSLRWWIGSASAFERKMWHPQRSWWDTLQRCLYCGGLWVTFSNILPQLQHFQSYWFANLPGRGRITHSSMKTYTLSWSEAVQWAHWGF